MSDIAKAHRAAEAKLVSRALTRRATRFGTRWPPSRQTFTGRRRDSTHTLHRYLVAQY